MVLRSRQFIQLCITLFLASLSIFCFIFFLKINSQEYVKIQRNFAGLEDNATRSLDTSVERQSYVSSNNSDSSHFNFSSNLSLDGCYHIYLDVGSNIGIQVRKLFEPHLYPNAIFVNLFNNFFGTSPSLNITQHQQLNPHQKICAVGFEPNSQHSKRLKTIEESYNRCGWFVKFFTETAVSNLNGNTSFYNGVSPDALDVGGGILSPSVHDGALDPIEPSKYSPVTVVRLADFLRTVVGVRKIGKIDPEAPPKVLMKMDIEGSEIEVMSDLIFSGSTQYVNVWMLEWHERMFQTHPERVEVSSKLRDLMQRLSYVCELTHNLTRVEGVKLCDFKYIEVDDNDYSTNLFQLPKC